jgi:trk system potassium uptake protein TrkH
VLNYRISIKFLSILVLFNGAFMLLTVLAALFYDEHLISELLVSSGILLVIGTSMFLATRKAEGKNLKKREGLFVVVAGWFTMALFGTLPYLLTGTIDNFSNAFFETMSGFTTTGASILDDIESLPNSILLWRSLTQWIGGMGIIVLAVAVLPILGIGSVQLFAAEAPGLSPDKISPRITDTARRLWLLYIGLTLVEMLLLRVGGMSFFDSLNHALTTVSTGGFSTKQASIAHYNSAFIEYVVSIFMFLGGMNFILIYFLTRLQWSKLRKNGEFRFYAGIVITFVLLVTIALTVRSGGHIEENFRHSLFQVISMISTTGFCTADYTTWGSGLTMFFFLLLFAGGSAGSTSGGVKMVRHLILFKIGRTELKRQMHPNAVIPLKINGKILPDGLKGTVLGFIISYIIIFAISSIALSAMGIGFDTAIGAVATSLGNVGPGISEVGPAFNFNFIPDAGKWLLAFLMLIGRLEIFTVLLLFSPVFWKMN